MKSGAKAISEYKRLNPNVILQLAKADLVGEDLRGADLRMANLMRADIRDADLDSAMLRHAVLVDADLTLANLHKANLRAASLEVANLTQANLLEADLADADLSLSNLSQTTFSGANLRNCTFAGTVISCDLYQAIGLETVSHHAPSFVATKSLEWIKGKAPATFLRGCGLADWEIEHSKLYDPNLPDEELQEIQNRVFQLRSTQPIQLTPVFFSYSHRDAEFVDSIQALFRNQGIRFWRDIHHAPAGPLESIFKRAMRTNSVVLVVLSKNSVASDWVEHEVELARELEKRLDRHVLCPIAIDDAWKNCKWPMRIRRQITKYNILSFHEWREGSKRVQPMFDRLIKGMKIFYVGAIEPSE